MKDNVTIMQKHMTGMFPLLNHINKKLAAIAILCAFIVSTISCDNQVYSELFKDNPAMTGEGLVLQGIVETLAGPAQGTTTSGDIDGIGNAARFYVPYGITTDGTNLYIADRLNNKIRKIVIATRVVTTIAGPAAGSTASGDTDGIGNAARFNNPCDITTDGINLYVADTYNRKIRQIVISTGTVTTIAGPAQGSTALGDDDGIGNAARFNNPHGITTDGTNLYVADANNSRIRKIVISTGAVTTIAGPASGSTGIGDTDGTGNAARFNAPHYLTTDGTNIYVTDIFNQNIRKIVIATRVVTTIVGPAPGSSGATGDTDGIGNAARFNNPSGITTDGFNLYVADTTNRKIRKVDIATGMVTTIAGPAQGSTVSGDTDGIGNSARFNNPIGITTDGVSLFVTDANNNKIRRIY